MNQRTLRALLASIGMMFATGTAFAGGEMFSIGLEEVVSLDAPGPGAGNLANSAATDTYQFTITETKQLYFETLSGACGLSWRAETPSSVQLFSTAMCVGDRGPFLLTEVGTYEIEVFAPGSGTGDYSFIVWDNPPDDMFVISSKSPVSDGVPAAGAGNIEEPGTSDVYTMALVAGGQAFFETLSGSCSLRWSVEAPDGSEMFSNVTVCVGDVGPLDIDQTGDYTITVTGQGAAIGTYSITVWDVNPADVFDIGVEEIIAEDAPGIGAGNIEEAGTLDVYTLDATAGMTVYFESLSAANCSLRWTAEAPDGTPIFENVVLCTGDRGPFLLDQTGAYTITAFGIGANTGTYSFTVWDLAPPDMFTIELDELVDVGIPGPGAGELEEPGTLDIYSFSAIAGTEALFDAETGGCQLRWACAAPDGTLLFENVTMCIGDVDDVLLRETGTYTLTVSATGAGVGTYALTVIELNPPEDFTIDMDEVVVDGAPAAGAGNIEIPGARDRYSLTVDAGTRACFEELNGSCNFSWSCVAPDFTTLFEDTAMCNANPGGFVLDQAGTYVILVDGEGDAFGTYSFVVNTWARADLNGDCNVGFDDLVILLSAWGTPDADLDDDGTTGFTDLVNLLTDWG